MRIALFLRSYPSLLPLVLAALVLFGVTHPALAQASDVTFSISATAPAPGQAVPTLTWSTTTPAPSSCAASGDAAWFGSRAASGVLTLPAVSANKNYVLACTF